MPLPDDLVRSNDDGGNSGGSSGGSSGGGNETVNPPTMEEGGTPVPVRDSDTGEPLNQAARNLDSATSNAAGQSSVDSGGNTPPSEGGDQPSPEDVGSAMTIGEQIEQARQQALSIQDELQNQASQIREEEGTAEPGSELTASSQESRQQDERARRQIETLTAPDSGVESARQAHQNVLNTLDQQMANVDQRAEMRQQEIEQEFGQEIQQTQEAQEQEEASTRSNLIRSGGYLGGSASSQAVLKRMSDTHRQEIASLEAQKQSAISEAQRGFMQEQNQLAREMAQQAVNLEETINTRRQQFFDNVLQISQEKRSQEEHELNTETTKLNNAQTRAELMAPRISENLADAESEQAQEEVLAGYAEKYAIDRNILAGKVQEFQSERTATQLENATSRARLQQINQELSQNEVISQNTFTREDGTQVTSLTMRTPEGEIVNERVQSGTNVQTDESQQEQEQTQEWEQARQFIENNPNESRQEIINGIRENTSLSISDAERVADEQRGVMSDDSIQSEAERLVSDNFESFRVADSEDELQSAKTEALSQIESIVNEAGGTPGDVERLRSAVNNISMQDL